MAKCRWQASLVLCALSAPAWGQVRVGPWRRSQTRSSSSRGPATRRTGSNYGIFAQRFEPDLIFADGFQQPRSSRQ
jgi:hypothetical protein